MATFEKLVSTKKEEKKINIDSDLTEDNFDQRQLRLEEKLNEYRSNPDSVKEIFLRQNLLSKKDCRELIEQKANINFYNPNSIGDVREAILQGKETLLFN